MYLHWDTNLPPSLTLASSAEARPLYTTLLWYALEHTHALSSNTRLSDAYE